MKATSALLAAAVAALAARPVLAQQTCRKIEVLKNVEASIDLSFVGCADPFFSAGSWTLTSVCYVSRERIPARIGGKSVGLETASAWLAPGAGPQQVVTLYRVYDETGQEAGTLHSLDNIYPADSKEDLVFIGGSGAYAGATGAATLSFTADYGNSPLPPLPGSVSFGRMKGEVCVPESP